MAKFDSGPGDDLIINGVTMPTPKLNGKREVQLISIFHIVLSPLINLIEFPPSVIKHKLVLIDVRQRLTI